jgi:hypothetical protein
MAWDQDPFAHSDDPAALVAEASRSRLWFPFPLNGGCLLKQGAHTLVFARRMTLLGYSLNGNGNQTLVFFGRRSDQPAVRRTLMLSAASAVIESRLDNHRTAE